MVKILLAVKNKPLYVLKNGDKVRVEAEMVKTTIPTVLAAAIEKDYADYTIESVHSVVKNGVTVLTFTPYELARDLPSAFAEMK